jgi:protein-disulfide isomerase
LVDDILAKYPNDVKVVIKNFPLSLHKQAYKAAQYALAANEQGKYKEMYHAIFDDYKNLYKASQICLIYMGTEKTYIMLVLENGFIICCTTHS